MISSPCTKYEIIDYYGERRQLNDCNNNCIDVVVVAIKEMKEYANMRTWATPTPSTHLT